jgi:hypothetical protein
MRALALLLALSVPAPVLSVGATPNNDGSVTVFWTLPPDPAVVGVTVFRERLDVFEPLIEFTLGLDTSLTDFNTVVTGDYRYWVHTRDAAGRLSDGAFVEVIGSGQANSGSVAVVSTGSGFWCWAAAAPGNSVWPLSVAFLLLFRALIPRIGT